MKVKVIPTVKVIPNSQNHRITESSGLEGTSLGHLVQLSKKKPQKLLKHVKNVTHNFLWNAGCGASSMDHFAFSILGHFQGSSKTEAPKWLQIYIHIYFYVT